MKKVSQRILCWILAVVMATTVLAVPAFAAEEGSVVLHVGNTTQTISGTVGNTMPLFIPEAPSGQYFAGWFTDQACTIPVITTTYAAGQTDFYACFVDERDMLIDTFAGYRKDPANLAVPYMSGGAYYQKLKRHSYSFKGLNGTDGTFFAYSTWSESGCYFITDENDHVFLTKPNTTYEITVTYRLKSRNPDSDPAVRLRCGYGFPLSSLADGDPTNRGFSNMGTEILLNEPTTEWQTLSYSFTTGADSAAVLPLAGIYVACAAYGAVANQLLVRSISIGTVDSKTSLTTYVGGEKDRVFEGLIGDTLTLYTPEAPEGKFFAGWYTDEGLTVPYTGTTFEKSVTALYAKFTDPVVVTTYVNDKTGKSLQGIPGQAMPLYVPDSPEGQHFVGWCADEHATDLLTDLTFSESVTALYAKFVPNVTEGTDTFRTAVNKTPFVYPFMYHDTYVQTISNSSWSYKGNTDDHEGKFFPSGTWAEMGVYFISTDTGEPMILQNYCHYKVTVTYRLSTKKAALGPDEQAMNVRIGYGFPTENLSETGSPTNKNFKYTGPQVDVTTVTTEWQTMSYEFDTEQIAEDLVPFAGIMVSLVGKGDDLASTLLVQSIRLEKTEYLTCRIELNGGYLDKDYTKSPDRFTFAGETEMDLPAAYRNRYAFDGWYDNQGLTGQAVTAAVTDGQYYAKWVPFGDVDGNDVIDTADLALLKKDLAGLNEQRLSGGSDNNADGQVDTTDLLLLKKYLAGLEDYMGPVRYIAFTFDDGPNAYLPKISDEFDRYNGDCTFFLLSDYLHLTNETVPYLQYALDHGNELGNHSHSHGHPNQWGYSGTISEMELCQEKIADAVGYNMKLARMPYLEGNDEVMRAMTELGLACCGSGVDTGDTDDTVNSEQEAAKIIKNAYDGAIVLMHATEKSYKALCLSIDELHRNGFKFVTVSEMFELFGYDQIPLGEQLTCAVRQTEE